MPRLAKLHLQKSTISTNMWLQQNDKPYVKLPNWPHYIQRRMKYSKSLSFGVVCYVDKPAQLYSIFFQQKNQLLFLII